MDVVQIEEIMPDIEESIKKRNYIKKNVMFSDIEMERDISMKFSLTDFKRELEKTQGLKRVESYRKIDCKNKFLKPFVVFGRKVLRHLLSFYIEPIVTDQNTYNANVVANLWQLSTKIEQDDEMIAKLQDRIQELEIRCTELENINGRTK